MPFRLLMTVPDSIANLHFPYHTVMISGNNNGGESRSSSADQHPAHGYWRRGKEGEERRGEERGSSGRGKEKKGFFLYK